MDALVPSLDEIEALNIRYSDDFARERQWTEHYLTDPVDDLDLFFEFLPGTRMLDVGCGWARYVHLFLDHGLDYIGIDHSIEMLKVAKETLPNVRFEHTSYRDLKQFADESFDGLWCCCVFGGEPKSNMPNVLRELKRVLVDGGIMIVVMPADMPSFEELCLGDDNEPLIYHASYDLSEFKELLQHEGFTIVVSVIRWQMGAMSVLVRK